MRAQSWVTRRTRHVVERGAASLETVGLIVVAALLVAALVVTLTVATPISPHVEAAVCKILSAGQGSCEVDVRSAEEHIPPDPCVTKANGHTSKASVSFVITLGKNESLLVEELSNGQYRVTRSNGSNVGATAGVGFNVSGTWDDKTGGLALGAGAGVEAQFSKGEVYYAESPSDVDDLVEAHYWDVNKDMLVGEEEGLFGIPNPVRWATDEVLDMTGANHEMPDSSETFYEGGFSVNAAAQATLIAANAEAGVGVQEVMGMSKADDGSTTTYLKAKISGKAMAGTFASDEQTAATVYAKAGAEGSVEAIIEVERDADGEVTGLRTKLVTSGSAEVSETGDGVADGPGRVDTYTVKTVELPVETAEDERVAANFMDAMGMGSIPGLPAGTPNPSAVTARNPLDVADALVDFAGAAESRGYVSRQEYDADNSSYGGTFDAKYIAKVGFSGTVDTVEREATSGEYWNGQEWATWEGCGS